MRGRAEEVESVGGRERDEGESRGGGECRREE